MSAVINVLNARKANQVLFLEALPKNKILDYINLTQKNPGKYVLAMADYLESDEEFDRAELITVPEWLERRKLELSKSSKHLLTKLATEKYQASTGQSPAFVRRKDRSNRWQSKLRAYPPDREDILEEALKETCRKHGLKCSKSTE